MTQARQTVGQSPYRAFITREPFLFYEMRTTADVYKRQPQRR